MLQKNLYRVVNLKSNQLGQQIGNDFTLEYYILESDVNIPEEKMTTQVYGVEITKIFCNEDGKFKKETSTINDVCCSENKIKLIIDLLARNTVTPIALYDLIEDILEGENIYIKQITKEYSISA